jgi:hypothetical protein
MKLTYRILTTLVFAVLFSLPMFGQQQLQHSKKYGKDHTADYQVGVLQSTEQVSSGSFTSCDHGCMTQTTGHNVHYVITDEGVYTIESPTSFGKSMLQGMLVSPNLPDVHIQWFMDDMNPGDKVLFAVNCGKHNDCYFWLPKPDKPGKEYMTHGWFRPRIAKTNTQQLCGTGKLSPAVESQVCKQPSAQPESPVVTPPVQPVTPPVAGSVSNFQTQQKAGMEQLKKNSAAVDAACDSGSAEACTNALMKMVEDAQAADAASIAP